MNEFFDKEILCMGTSISQRVYGENAEEIAKIVARELVRLEKLMSFYLDSSDVSRLNNAAGEKEVILSNETLQVIQKAKIYSELSKGSFDITAAPLIKLWGIFTDNERIPLNDEIEEVLGLISYKDIRINEKSNSARLLNKGQKIDLGGIAKGYAADRAIKIYKQNGINSAFINLGGNVLVLGNKPDGSPWKIGLQNPFGRRGEYIGIIRVTDKSVVTSGDYMRYFEKDNVRYHHIIDPKTGYPANSGISSATVISDSSVDADALSTAIFVLGLNKGIKLIEEIDGAEAIFVTKDKKVYVTEGARENFLLIESSDGFEYLENVYD